MTDLQAAWLAATMDCEGCFAIAKELHKKSGATNYRGRIFVGSTTEELLESCQFIAGGYIGRWRSKIKYKGKPTKTWVLTGDSLRKALTKIIPYLVVKREQAEILMAFNRTICVDRTRKNAPKN